MDRHMDPLSLHYHNKHLPVIIEYEKHHCVMVEAANHFRLDPTSILDIIKVFDCLLVW